MGKKTRLLTFPKPIWADEGSQQAKDYCLWISNK
jgi:hypothetical protein